MKNTKDTFFYMKEELMIWLRANMEVVCPEPIKKLKRKKSYALEEKNLPLNRPQLLVKVKGILLDLTFEELVQSENPRKFFKESDRIKGKMNL